MSIVARRTHIPIISRIRSSFFSTYLSLRSFDMEKPRNLVDFDSSEINKFLGSFDTVITDCDGVVWLGDNAIEGSLDTLKKLKSMGKRVLFVSNNSTMTLDEYCEKFRTFGYPGCADDIAIPSKVICWYLKNRGFDGKAFVLGTNTFRKVLQSEGIDVAEPGANFLTESYEAIAEEYKKCPEAKAVIIDIDVNINWAKLGRAVTYLRNSDVIYLVGAIDRKMPISRNLTLLGNGLFVDLLSKETNRVPICCGKPSETLKNYITDKFSLEDPGRCLFIGDSLENDMKFADLCGFGKLWVGSGIDTPDSTSPEDISSPPDYYLPTLSLLLPLLETSLQSDYADCCQKPV